MLNNVQVRSEEDIDQAKQKKKAPPIQAPLFRDQDGIAENFIKQFFPAFDNDRPSLVGHFYGSTSTFSLAVDTNARAVSKDVLAPWESWIKKSRNQMKITSYGGKSSRIFKGVDAIKETWLSLPTSRHPDPVAENEKWCIECQPIPGLPDPTGSSPTGVGGLFITLHGEFEEVKFANGASTCRRSFDRTFILGPGNTPSGIQVLNDMWIVRAYGGYVAFKSTVTPQGSPQMATQQLSAPPPASSVEIPQGLEAPPGFGLAAADKTSERVQQELLALELSKLTRMTLEFSIMCLQESNWDLQQAGQSFEANKANIPPTAFW